MAGANPSGGASRPSLRQAPRPVAGRSHLRVVGDAERLAKPRWRSIATLLVVSTLIVMGTLGILAALHALQVEVQVQIDSTRSEIVELETQLNRSLTSLAEIDSPQGLAEAAQAQGLVEPADLVMLPQAPEGMLDPPIGADPFAGAG